MGKSLDDVFASHEWEFLNRVNGWTVRRDGDLVEFETSARDGERYTVLCICDDYPHQAPEVVFINISRSAQDVTAWPVGNGAFHGYVKPPPDSFICMPLIRGGLMRHHEWRGNLRAKPWNPELNTLMDIFNFLDQLLKSDDYMGRGSK